MRLVIFGASGKVGRLATAEALRRGHEVTVFIHSTLPSIKGNAQALQQRRGDVHSPADVAAAVEGQEAVVCAVGSWGSPQKDIVATATRHILAGMQQHGVQRFVGLTGVSAFASGDKLSLFDRLEHTATRLIAPKILRDGEAAIAAAGQSGRTWTIIRSPVMTNSAKTAYHLGMEPPSAWHVVSRPAVAACLVDLSETGKYAGSAPYIA